jgi:fructuronate reductase
LAGAHDTGYWKRGKWLSGEQPIERLSNATLTQLRPGVARFGYDRAAVRRGVLHFGPGAFHRAHQAWFFDRLLEHDPSWGICGVALKSPTVPAALTPQDGLYVLAELEAQPRMRVIGSVLEALAAPTSAEAVLARLADPATRWVSLTITEKGYAETHPTSAAGWIVAGLADRRAAGLAPFVTASCDNLPDNGRRLRADVLRVAGQRDPALADWIAARAKFPCSMVDSITPAADDTLLQAVRATTGLVDLAPVQREGFCQWVIEDDLGDDAPDLASVGVTLTKDVAGYEQAKLRLLNAAHSSLAYLGLLKGHETVADAVADPELATFAERLMREDIAPLLRPPPDLDLSAYITTILKRFANPGIRHRLAQIAMDGSQKLPIRVVPSLAAALAAGRPIARLAAPLAAWVKFLRRERAAGRTIADPWAATGDVGGSTIDVLLRGGVLSADLAAAPAVAEALD